MKKLVASVFICTALILSGNVKAAAPSTSPAAAVVSVDQIVPSMMIAQVTQERAGYSFDEESSSSGSSGRGLGRLIKFAIIGVIAVGGWFLRWVLSD